MNLPQHKEAALLAYTDRAESYVDDVLAGKIPSCQHMLNACRRHRADKTRAAAGDWLYAYDPIRAGRVCRFAELLPHVKGEWALPQEGTGRAQRLKLEPWQCFVLCSIFGWYKRATGTRRFTKASIYVPRKNAKSTLAAVVAWWMFVKDDEPGAEVYCAATSKHQAGEVFNPAKAMGKAEPKLCEAGGVVINASNMIRPAANAKFEPIISRPRDGASPHCAIVDEYHEHKTPAVYQSLRTGMGARRQPLLFVISTAGVFLEGPCRNDWVFCAQLLAGTIQDETHFAVIWTIDDGDDWTSEITLRKANPNFGVSVIAGSLLDELAAAKQDPKLQADFKTKRLNIWVGTRSGLFNVQIWLKCADRTLKVDQFAGCDGVMSLDLAWKRDLCATMRTFKRDDVYHLFGRYYLPRETAQLPHNRHLAAWAREGHVVLHDAPNVDFRIVADDIVADYTRFNMAALVYDAAHAAFIAPDLQERGVEMIEAYSSNTSRAEEWVVKFDALYREGKIKFDGDPVLSWAVGNVVGRKGRRGLVWMDKPEGQEHLKIDPAVVAVMSVGLFESALTLRGGAPGIAFI